MRAMTARFPGKCKSADCGGRIAAGDPILWGKATGAVHVACAHGIDTTDNGASSIRRAAVTARNMGGDVDGTEDSNDRAQMRRDNFAYSIGYSHGLDCGCRTCASLDADTY